MYICNCGKEFHKKQQYAGHKSSCGKIQRYTKNRGLVKKTKKTDFICKFCGKKFKRGQQLGGHIVMCSENPNAEITKNKISKQLIGKPLSNKHKNSIRKTIMEKIKNSDWHYSFSKSRTYTYKGIKLYGKWELNYAKWLDKNNIKWERPIEKFYYEFENEEHYYTPDFYIVKDDEYIEIKGYMTDKDKAKWKWFPKKLKLKKLFGKDLYNMGIIDSYKEI